MGLIICVGLLLLTSKVLSLPFDPQDNVLLSRAHSYSAFHNQSNCWVCGALPSSSVEGSPWWVSQFQGKDFLPLCEYLHQQESHVTSLFNLLISSNPKMDWCNTLYLNYGPNGTFNDYFAIHKNVNGSRPGGFLPDVYQIWDEIIWLISEKGHLLPNAPICWEQVEPSPEVSRQLNNNELK